MSSLPGELVEVDINEFLKRHEDTHLARRQLSHETAVGPQHALPNHKQPSGRPVNTSPTTECSGWCPAVQLPSISSGTTRESRSLFDTHSSPSYATSIPEETEVEEALEPGHGQVGFGGGDDPFTFPCEFAGYARCNARFRVDQVELFLAHVKGAHLQGNLPRQSVCWFCDSHLFSTSSNLDVDKEACLRQRMYHIIQHFEDTNPNQALSIRPDFHFFRHLATQRLIPQRIIDAGEKWSELPEQYRICIGEAPPSRRPPRRVVIIEKNCSNDGGRRRAVQRYHD